MPLCWLMSLFMVMLILLMMVDMYLYSEGVLLEIEYEKLTDCKNNYMW